MAKVGIRLLNPFTCPSCRGQAFVIVGGLCRPCYRKPENRHRYFRQRAAVAALVKRGRIARAEPPAARPAVPKPEPVEFGPIESAAPTSAYPGTPEKVEVMAARAAAGAAAGESIFHPLDPTVFVTRDEYGFRPVNGFTFHSPRRTA